MRRSPGDHAAFLRSTEQLLDVPLTSECVHDPAGAPVVSSARPPPAEPSLLQLAAQCGINVPMQGRRLVGSPNGCHDKARQMLPGERLLDPMFQTAVRDATRFYQPLELVQFHLRFAQGDRDAAFLPCQ